MAANFSGATDKITCGMLAHIATPPQVTMVTWALTTDSTTEQRACQKGTGGSTAYQSILNLGLLTTLIGRVTTDTQAIADVTTFPAFALNRPLFIVGQNDVNVIGNNKIFVGAIGQPAREASSYILQDVGTGAQDTWPTRTWIVGNKANDSMPWLGWIAFQAVYPYLITLAQIHLLQKMFEPGSRVIDPNAIAGAAFWMLPGLESMVMAQPDYSGWGNHGTVTGATRVSAESLQIRAPQWRARRRVWIPVTPPSILRQMLQHAH